MGKYTPTRVRSIHTVTGVCLSDICQQILHLFPIFETYCSLSASSISDFHFSCTQAAATTAAATVNVRHPCSTKTQIAEHTSNWIFHCSVTFGLTANVSDVDNHSTGCRQSYISRLMQASTLCDTIFICLFGSSQMLFDGRIKSHIWNAKCQYSHSIRNH